MELHIILSIISSLTKQPLIVARCFYHEHPATFKLFPGETIVLNLNDTEEIEAVIKVRKVHMEKEQVLLYAEATHVPGAIDATMFNDEWLEVVTKIPADPTPLHQRLRN